MACWEVIVKSLRKNAGRYGPALRVNGTGYGNISVVNCRNDRLSCSESKRDEISLSSSEFFCFSGGIFDCAVSYRRIVKRNY